MSICSYVLRNGCKVGDKGIVNECGVRWVKGVMYKGWVMLQDVRFKLGLEDYGYTTNQLYI